MNHDPPTTTPEDRALVQELLEAHTRHRPSDYEAREPARQTVLARLADLRARADAAVEREQAAARSAETYKGAFEKMRDARDQAERETAAALSDREIARKRAALLIDVEKRRADAANNEVARLRAILHHAALSDGVRTCDQCERAWFPEIGASPEASACPWCENEKLFDACATAQADLRAFTRSVETEIATTERVRGVWDKGEVGYERLDGALEVLTILLRKLRAGVAAPATAPPPAEVKTPQRVEVGDLVIDLRDLLGNGGALRVVNELLRKGGYTAGTPPISPAAETVHTTPIPTREEREAAVRFFHPTMVPEAFDRWAANYGTEVLEYEVLRVNRLAALLAGNRGEFRDGIEAAALVVRGWPIDWNQLGPLYAAICRLAPCEGDPK